MTKDKLMRMLFKPMLAAMLVFFTASANATPIKLEISENADFSGMVVSADGDGFAMITSAIGNWGINVVTGVSGPFIGDENVDKLDLNSVNVSGGTGTIYIRLTGTGYEKLDAQFKTAFGGTTDGSVSFQSYADDTNEAFGKGTLLSDKGFFSAGAFSDEDSGGISMTGPYSLSIYAAVTHTGAGQISSFDYLVAVPEPGTLALLGIGLLGLGLVGRRKA